MIYVTGDTHRDFFRLSHICFPEQKDLTKNDYVIICGDFGGVWIGDNYKREDSLVENPYGFMEEYTEWELLTYLDKFPFTTLFISGNHENFDALNKYPKKDWHGGVVSEIRPSVLLLRRGYVFDIDGYKCFTFGGAKSHDTWGGIFEKDDKKGIARAKRMYEPFRINHLSWWKEEEPTEEEFARGIDNLEANSWNVDFVFTHECSASDNILLHGTCKNSYQLPYYFENLKDRLTYKKWFFGHHHDNLNISDRDILIYEQIIPISKGKDYYNNIF